MLLKHNSFDTRPLVSIPIDYFVVGHLTADLTNSGIRLGGTAAFSGLTAYALGLHTGILTSFDKDLDITQLDKLWLINKTSSETTTFKNISNGIERSQYLYQIAERLTKNDLPSFNQNPAILHLGPVADEVDPGILECFPDSLKCLTPQGWYRSRNSDNQVTHQSWQNFEIHLSRSDIAVISVDDVQKDEETIARMASIIPVFVVTESNKGARVYWNNDARFIHAPEVKYEEDTGAGDIFAAAFFYRYFTTKDPWEAGRFAVLLASWSVTRQHLNSIPKPDEIEKAKIELI